MPISAIFFTHFDPRLGPKVIVEHPPHSITPFPPPDQLPSPHPHLPNLISDKSRPPLVPIDLLTDFLIPKQTLCDRLVTVVYGEYRILSYPVRIEGGRYDRNEYIFTLSVVVHVNVEFSGYPGMVTKIAKMFRAMEEQSGWISTEARECEEIRKGREERIRKKVEERERRERGEDGEGEGSNKGGGEEEGSVKGGDAEGSDSVKDETERPEKKVQKEVEEQEDAWVDDEEEEEDENVFTMIWDSQGNLQNDSFDYEWWADVCGTGLDCGHLYHILRSVMEDLNCYGECCVSIDDSNTINLKLIRKRPPPIPIKPFHVPHPLVPLSRHLDSKSTDLTLLRVIPHLNGLNTMARVAQLADADYNLTRKCVQHLLYYNLVTLISPILFHGIYSTTSLFTDFITNKELLKECLTYLAIKTYPDDPTVPLPAAPGAIKKIPTPADIVDFYANLRHGLTLKDWILEKKAWKYDIDVRRLIAFGLLHGFLYRVQKYVLLDPMLDEHGNEEFRTDYGLWTKYLTGDKCLDEVCLEQNMGEREAWEFLEHKTNRNCVLVHR